MFEVKRYCSARCKHNSGNGCYNLCNHPEVKDRAPYAGIDRYYFDGCELKETEDSKHDIE